MRDILYAVMTVSLCAGIVCFLSPEGKNGGLKRQIGFAVSVAVCLALVSPLKRRSPAAGLIFPSRISSPPTPVPVFPAGRMR